MAPSKTCSAVAGALPEAEEKAVRECATDMLSNTGRRRDVLEVYAST